jgi:hypothetical protein
MGGEGPNHFLQPFPANSHSDTGEEVVHAGGGNVLSFHLPGGAMLSFSETILNATIWSLTLAGLFFGIRGTLRKRRRKKEK